MQEFSFWPTSPPRRLGGVFELRSYKLHPGNLLEWETHWRKGLEARLEVMEGVGAWFVQIGELDTGKLILRLSVRVTYVNFVLFSALAAWMLHRHHG